MFEDFFTSFRFSFDVDVFLSVAGDSPYLAMWYLFLNGGWIGILWVLLWGGKYLYLDAIQTKSAMKKEWLLMRVTVPRTTEQTPKAVENLFASFSGAHASYTWTETWLQGETQSQIAVEIVSNEGEVGFYVYCINKMRDLVEAAIYAQYPDADIDVIDDYVKKVPQQYPSETHDLWGCEMIPVTSDAYPLKTYRDFEDMVSGEFKDPLANMLEIFSRLGPGEHAWYQIVLVPTDQKASRERAKQIVNKIKGIKEEAKSSFAEQAILFPLKALQAVLTFFFAGEEEVKKPADKSKEAFPKMMALSSGERDVLDAVERKAGKLGFDVKIRIVYVAKKEVMKKSRIANPFIGAIKQTNTFNMNALKPEAKKVGVSSSIWWFKSARNSNRKNKLIAAYRSRSSWKGMPRFHLSVEELATLWHFPIFMQVKAPQLLRTQAKKSEPPSNLPFGL